MLLVLLLPPAGLCREIHSPTPNSIDASGRLALPLGARVEVFPSNWLLATGNVTSFFASWVGVPPNCTVRAQAFEWFLPGPFLGGTLNNTFGPTVDFNALSSASGQVNLTVRSELDAACGEYSGPFTSEATANVTVVGPLTVSNLTVFPNPVSPGTPVVENLTVSGGLPPYAVTFDTGDQQNVTLSLPQEGAASIRHTYLTGSFVPTVSVRDAEGIQRYKSLAQPVAVSASLAAAVSSPAQSADVGTPFSLLAEVAGDSTPNSYEWELSTRVIYLTPSIQPTFNTTGLVRLRLLVGTAVGDLVTVDDSFPVVVPPELGLSVSTPAVGAGTPFPLVINVVGGTGPFDVTLLFPSSVVSLHVKVPTDGTYVESVVAPTPGKYSVVGTLVDSDGVAISLFQTLADVKPPVNVSLSESTRTTPQGEEFEVASSIWGGIPPYAWILSVSAPPQEATDYIQLTNGPTTVVWSGVFSVEGNVTFSLIVRDGSGQLVQRSDERISIEPLIASIVTQLSDAIRGTPVSFQGSIEGGLAPYAYTFRLSTGLSSAGNLTTSGEVTWTPLSESAGSLGVTFVVTDALGNNRSSTILATIPSTPPPVPPPLRGSPSPLQGEFEGLAVLSVVFVLGACLLIRRRRKTHEHRSEEPTHEKATEVVRQLLASGHGLDRESLELLARDQGVPDAIIHSVVDQGVESGAYRVETDEQGKEILSMAQATSVDGRSFREGDEP